MAFCMLLRRTFTPPGMFINFAVNLHSILVILNRCIILSQQRRPTDTHKLNTTAGGRDRVMKISKLTQPCKLNVLRQGKPMVYKKKKSIFLLQQHIMKLYVTESGFFSPV